MSKYIDKEKLLDSVYQNTPLIPSMAGMTAEAMRLKIAVLIDNFDSIDVVHCRDCKYRYKMACHKAEFYECSHIGLTSENGKITHVGVDDDYFCADGERKEQDDLDWEEPADLEMGYDPYLGCYTDDC